ncbi:hypothetical protein Q1695_005838 [Nippostrongylus brasiliensis]|nr:hypothetical protein Q1695_005838 [Nippostrongylus brasiliensis]
MPLVLSGFSGEVEDESASAKTFFLTLQKSSEPRLAWMERTLGKGLNYHVRKFKANRNYKAPNFSTIVCDSNGNKNRYDDIKCIDDTRVVLRETTSGYINANYIISLSGRKYICTQAPMDTTMADFWKMVIQEKCRMIVMLCSEIEGTKGQELARVIRCGLTTNHGFGGRLEDCDGKSKCTSYYPARVGDKVTFGKTTITSLTQSISAQFGYTLSICDVQTGPNRFKLRHIHCVSWPDHSAPQNAKCAIEIHRILVKNRLSRAVVIHCSAGIGRTCTLVGAELLLERIQLRRNPSAVSVLRLMRRCRMGAVQVSVQYVFMLLILLELFCEEGVMKESDPRMKEFREKYAKVLRLYNRKLEKQRLKEREENQQAANRITKVTETTTKQTVTKG